MSAIFGLVRFDGGEVSREDLNRQMAALEHRGRDRVDVWRHGSVGFGRRLMRITHEDLHDIQPVHGGGFTLVADARLDNREEIAGKLGLDRSALPAMADSALLAAAWRRWGADCVEHLLGDFAFGVWDEARRRLTLARDHMGQRHLFYHRGEGFLAFATENRGLFALPQTPRHLDVDRVVLRLAMPEGGTAEPGSTFHKNVRALAGGTLLTLDASGELAERQYWAPRADPAHLGRDEAYYVAAYRQVLQEAVACRVRRAAAPAAVFLSGGFDSAAIAALGAQAAAAHGQRFVGVCSAMPEGYDGPIRHAREWAGIIGRHTPNLSVRYVASSDLDLLEGMEAEFASHNDPHSPNRAINNALLREVAATGARVVMDGHGGDYTLNPRGVGYAARLLRQGRLLAFVREFRAGRRQRGLSRSRMMKTHVLWEMLPLPLRQLHRRWRMGLPLRGPLAPLAKPVLARRAPGPRRRRRLFHTPGDNAERFLRLLQGEQAMGTAIPAAAHGLEFTQPFHDKRVVELGLAIPERFQARNGEVRVLAKAALADVLPPQLLHRRPGNDPLDPDFAAMLARVRPRVLAEIDQMEAGGQLAEFFDFARMREGVSRPMRDGDGDDQMPVRQALLAFITARYIRWYRGDNA